MHIRCCAHGIQTKCGSDDSNVSIYYTIFFISMYMSIYNARSACTLAQIHNPTHRRMHSTQSILGAAERTNAFVAVCVFDTEILSSDKTATSNVFNVPTTDFENILMIEYVIYMLHPCIVDASKHLSIWRTFWLLLLFWSKIWYDLQAHLATPFFSMHATSIQTVDTGEDTLKLPIDLIDRDKQQKKKPECLFYQ